MRHNQIFTLSFEGNSADNHELDFYDAAQGLISFQRTLALTLHLVVNNEIIIQAPSLRNAEIFALPVEEGSWKIKAGIVIPALVTASSMLPNNTVLGHLVYSIYDLVISQSLGFHVDYSEPLLKSYENQQLDDIGVKVPSESQIDSLIEKVQPAIKELHRPIYKNETASRATITAYYGHTEQELTHEFNIQTYEYIKQTVLSNEAKIFVGVISSYNINTFKGRIFLFSNNRPIPFELSRDFRESPFINIIVDSMSQNARGHVQSATIYFQAYENTSVNGHLKSLSVVNVSDSLIQDSLLLPEVE
jgi:hypothetical protein